MGLADAKTAMNYFDLQKGVGYVVPDCWAGEKLHQVLRGCSEISVTQENRPVVVYRALEYTAINIYCLDITIKFGEKT